MMSGEKSAEKVRLDKWLWAARFFKTRALAKQAIDGGKVSYNGVKGKASRLVELGATLVIQQGWDKKTVEVQGVSDQRRGAPEAQLLYKETEASEVLRQQAADQRKAQGGALIADRRPNKKQRRMIHRFKEEAAE